MCHMSSSKQSKTLGLDCILPSVHVSLCRDDYIYSVKKALQWLDAPENQAWMYTSLIRLLLIIGGAQSLDKMEYSRYLAKLRNEGIQLQLNAATGHYRKLVCMHWMRTWLISASHKSSLSLVHFLTHRIVSMMLTFVLQKEDRDQQAKHAKVWQPCISAPICPSLLAEPAPRRRAVISPSLLSLFVCELNAGNKRSQPHKTSICEALHNSLQP